MKTSNKMILGLFILIVLGIITMNVVYKKKLAVKQQNRIEISVAPGDSTGNAEDSVAMEKAISNQ